MGNRKGLSHFWDSPFRLLLKVSHEASQLLALFEPRLASKYLLVNDRAFMDRILEIYGASGHDFAQIRYFTADSSPV